MDHCRTSSARRPRTVGSGSGIGMIARGQRTQTSPGALAMQLRDLIWFLLIGVLAGFLASQIMKGPRLSLVGNLILGVIGALVGGFVFSLLGLATSSLLGSLVTATVGAVLLIWLVGKARKA